MNERDEFASRAMQALISLAEGSEHIVTALPKLYGFEAEIADEAYKMADAMLEARKRGTARAV